ncbi:MAG TPA: ABC transporter permease [Cyclobacteriaceae bacterium]|jgi:putative ABC transport system permease protein|nr:ABC transporter permease [Cyclobacteriaceae bacterium]
MVRNLLTTAWRSLIKHKFFSSLNIIGLAVGMAVFLMIAQYVHFERSYEDFIPNADNIYRVKLETYMNNQLIMSSAENYPGVGPALKNEFPEVTGFARLYNMGYKNNIVITNEDAQPSPIAFKQRRFLYADSSFLPLMGYTMIAGDARTALSHPFNAVISEKYAHMYFGNEDPIGKSLRLQDDDFINELVKVTGVVKDIPSNTHLKFDVLFSYKTLFARGDWAIKRYDQGWRRKDMYTFIRLQPNANAKQLESKFPAIVAKYKPENKQQNQVDILTLQQLKSIHLNSNLAEEVETNGDGRIVSFLSLIGLFVLIIAWINYVNLSTAKAMERAKEVGVRKVMGAFKAQLIQQFFVESGLINLLSLVIAFALVTLVMPYFNSLSGLSLNVSYLFKDWFLVLTASLWLMGTTLSGFYPAIVLSSFKPVVVLKGKLKNSLSGIFLRKALVVCQFIASVALIAGTFIVYDQLHFMMNQDLGVNIDQVLVVDRPGIAPKDRKAFNSTIDVFRDELKKDPTIQGVTASATIPGKQREYKAGVKKYGSSDDQLVTVKFNSMDYDFIDVFKMKLVAGRAFSENFVKDQDTTAIITESTSRLLGFKKPEEAIGQTLAIPDFQWNPIIVGVVNDYHQVSFKKPLDPSIFFCSKYGGEFYSMRITTSSLARTIEQVKLSWEKAFPGNPFEYFFLDDYFNRQYENERKFGNLFLTFSALAVLVGCLGLFGLSAYTATQRTKEIGIRKVLGSSEQGIFYLLSQEYLKLVGLAILIASPLVWWIMNGWMQNFAYRTSISVSIFAIAGVLVLIVALVTVSYQTLRAARIKPVDSLRYE